MTHAQQTRRRSQESGFAYLMALFMALVMIVASTAILQRMATQRQRERESEMIWRGNQYARAIRLFYHKTGKYPTSLDDLQKALPDLHFIRQMYKDPMNKNDGAWRLIWVNPAGQIIGSVHYASLQQMAVIDMGYQTPGVAAAQIPGQPGIAVSSMANSGSNGADNGGNASGQGSGSSLPLSQPFNPDDNSNLAPQTPPPTPNQEQSPDSGLQSSQNPSQPTQNGAQAPGQGLAQGPDQGSGQGMGGTSPLGQPAGLGQSNVPVANSAILLQKPTGPVDGPVLGAFITGVAGTTDQRSIRIWHGGKKYKDWEFIWNPLEDQARAIQSGLGANPAQGLQPGQPAGSASPFGSPATQPPTGNSPGNTGGLGGSSTPQN